MAPLPAMETRAMPARRVRGDAAGNRSNRPLLTHTPPGQARPHGTRDVVLRALLKSAPLFAARRDSRRGTLGTPRGTYGFRRKPAGHPRRALLGSTRSAGTPETRPRRADPRRDTPAFTR